MKKKILAQRRRGAEAQRKAGLNNGLETSVVA
jgi:hypothetical protein